MSKGIRGGKKGRDPLERWYTPDEEALAHVRWTLATLGALSVLSGRPARQPELIVDPFAGGGAYLRAADAAGLLSEGYDIAPGDERVIEAAWEGAELAERLGDLATAVELYTLVGSRYPALPMPPKRCFWPVCWPTRPGMGKRP